jgi:DNA-binding transcriptional MerR regulator
MKIGQLAKAVGVSSDTVRFYERLGLLQGGLPPEQVRAFVQEKIAVIDRRIGELQDLRERLDGLALGADCPLRRDCDGGQPPVALTLIAAETA